MNPAPLGTKRRLFVLVGGVCVALIVFNLPQFQHKMFFSGTGGLKDLSYANTDLQSNARKVMWESLLTGIRERPLFGHGANACASLVEQLVGMTHPHNDWLRLLYDYGMVGTAIFVLCLIIQIWDILRRVSVGSDVCRVLAYTSLAALGELVLFMVTDNVLVYPHYFGNILFLTIGLRYAHLESYQAAYAGARWSTGLWNPLIDTGLTKGGRSFGLSWCREHVGQSAWQVGCSCWNDTRIRQ
jgi:hypothetical protein